MTDFLKACCDPHQGEFWAFILGGISSLILHPILWGRND